MHGLPSTQTGSGIHRVANLRLRGRGGPIPVRVRWPVSQALGSPPPVIVVLADPSGESAAGPADETLCNELCAGLGALVLRASWAARSHDGPGSALERAANALAWVADHVGELDGDPARLIVAGRGGAAAAAGALALRARDDRWPPLVAQVLVLTGPCAAGVHGRQPSSRGAEPAPATIVSPRAGSRCARYLRAAGARVSELVDPRVDPGEYPDLPYVPTLTDSLRGVLT
jgi:acetyl esterase